MKPEALSFHELNAILIDRLGKTRCYVGKRWSYLKLFQHAISYSANNWSHKLLPVNWTQPWPVIALRFFLKTVRAPRAKRPELKEIVVIDPGRSVIEQDRVVSAYFDKVLHWIGRDRTTVITVREEGMRYSDYLRGALPQPQLPPDKEELLVLRELVTVCRATRASRAFSGFEMHQISSSFEVFFTSFRFWYHLFLNQPVKRIIFTSHYHNEGLIAACDVLHIRLDELQHGLIAANDVYNVYPTIFRDAVKNALFPKRIYVYGEYWKRMLLNGCEHSEEEIVVAGDYLSGSAEAIPEHPEKKNVILIGAQKRMWPAYDHILTHLTALLKIHSDWSVLIRLHPLEDRPDRYEAFVSDRMTICSKSMTLHECLVLCRIQVSIYSTTFYDALGYDMVNFAVKATGFEQYVSDMVSEGVAYELHPDEDPIHRYRELVRAGWQHITRDEVYAAPNPGAIIP